MIIRPHGFFGKRYVLASPGVKWWRIAWLTTPVMIVAALAPIWLLGMQPAAYLASIMIGFVGYGVVHLCTRNAMGHARPEDPSGVD